MHTIGVVEHLREDDVGSSVDLLPEMVHLLLGRFAVGVSFGEASDLRSVWVSDSSFTAPSLATHSDVKVVAIVLTNVLDEVDGMVEASLGGDPLLSTARRITTKSENVATSRILGFLSSWK